MQAWTFDRIEVVIQVALEQDVPETIGREALSIHLTNILGADQMMPLIQLIA